MYLHVTEKERDRRWRKIKESMMLHDLDCLVIVGRDSGTQWGCYVSYTTNLQKFTQAFVVFPLEGEPVTLVYATIPNRGEAWTKVKHAAYPYAQSIREELQALGVEEGNIGLAGIEIMTATTHIALIRELPKAHFEGTTHLLNDIMKIRSSEEMKIVKKSAELIDIGFEAMIRAAKPGKKEYEIHGAAINAIHANGGHPRSRIIVSSGVTPGLPHEPTHRVLQLGDTLLNEFIYVPVNGYWSVQFCRPIALGEPSKKLQRMFDICLEVYKTVEKELKPGKTYGEIEKTAEDIIKSAGFEPIWVALSHHVFPILRSSKELMEQLRYLVVRPGMDFINHPCVCTPEGKCMLLGNSMEITDNGPQSLSKIPLEYVVV